MPDKLPTRPVTVIVEWKQGYPFHRNQFLRSLGLNLDLWGEPQVAQIDERTTLNVFGAKVPPHAVYATAPEWRCRFGESAEGWQAFSINGTAVGAYLYELNEVRNLPASLQAAVLHDAKEETLPPYLSKLQNLTSLDLSDCDALCDLSGLAELVNLTSLNLGYRSSSNSVAELSGLTNLTDLQLPRWEALTDLSEIVGLNKLTTLNLSGCKSMFDLRGLAGMDNLSNLDLSFCSALTDLNALSGLRKLTNLDLGWCSALPDLRGLGGLDKLASLGLSRCSALTDLGALSGLRNLTKLDMSNCDHLTDVGALAKLENLTSLDLKCCNNLTDLSALSGLRSLKRLYLQHCEALTDLSALSGLISLKRVHLDGCPYLNAATRVKPLLSLHRLKEFELDAPDLRLRVLLSVAHARADTSFLRELLINDKAMTVMQRSFDGQEVAACIAKALGLVGSSLPEGYIAQFLDECRKIPDITSAGWCEIFREVGKGTGAQLAAWLKGLAESSAFAPPPLSGLEEYIAAGGRVEQVSWPALLDAVLTKISRDHSV